MRMAMGAIEERVDYEMDRVIANIIDQNTKATGKRKVTITLELMPDEYRQVIARFGERQGRARANERRYHEPVCFLRARHGRTARAGDPTAGARPAWHWAAASRKSRSCSGWAAIL